MTEVLARLRDKVSALSAPTAFHGTTARPPFFEGWYYKWVDAQGLRPWAVIPGVCHATDPAESHAFVQLYDGRSRRRIYARYPLDAFHASSRRFDVRIGPNHFTADGVALSLTADGHDVEGRVRCEGLSPWPVSALYPGYMGWMALTPFIGCYHAVLSLDHGLSGSLAVDGERVPFDGGRGYTEKDWGRRFPDAYVWLQCNHFERPGTSLVVSLASVPWMGHAFRGFVVGLRHAGGFERFATYSGASLAVNRIDDLGVTLTAQSGPLRLELTAERPPPSGGDALYAPDGRGMSLGTPQALDAAVEVRLTHGRGAKRRIVYEGKGRCGALEIKGRV